jgi:hypothetical protein
LATRFEITLAGCLVAIYGVEISSHECKTPEKCASKIMEFVRREKPRIGKSEESEDMYGQRSQ